MSNHLKNKTATYFPSLTFIPHTDLISALSAKVFNKFNVDSRAMVMHGVSGSKRRLRVQGV